MCASLVRVSCVAIIAITILAAIGTLHESRRATLEAAPERCGEPSEDRRSGSRQARRRIDRAARALRSQPDLAVVIADLGINIGDGDAKEAGDAALALAMARTGARGGFVQLSDDSGRLRIVAARGIWSADRVTPPAVFRDVVAMAALAMDVPSPFTSCRSSRSTTANLATPLVDRAATPLACSPCVVCRIRRSCPRHAPIARRGWPLGRSLVLRPVRGAGPVAARGEVRAST